MWKNPSELFSLVDDARGGRLQVLKRKLKFRLRHAWFRKEVDQFKHYLGSKQLMDLLHSDPAITLKCTRSYLWTGLNGSRRLLAQLSFYEWLLSQYSSRQITHFYKVNHTTVCHFSVKDRSLEVQLRPARNLGREGELAALLCLDGQVLMKASFTVLPLESIGLPGQGYAMYVGAYQGEKNTLDLFKETTLLMERTKPSHLLFNVLQSLAQIWNLHAIVGVSDDDHAYAGYTRTLAKRIKTNYDHIWQELGGDKDKHSGHWLLPRNWVPRPLEEIESKKRAAYRRRNAIRQAFIDACTSGGPHLLANPDAY
ncbi:MAG: hypothetical protein RI902_378 [Pseudomonadota bacterium]|jgi:uncharacterized protein VirK/YbjX